MARGDGGVDVAGQTCAGGPQDLVDAGRLAALPDFDRARFAAWKKKLRVRG
jgi:hypothetical protein